MAGMVSFLVTSIICNFTENQVTFSPVVSVLHLVRILLSSLGAYDTKVGIKFTQTIVPLTPMEWYELLSVNRN